MKRIVQYVQRIIAVYFSTLPGNYQKRKVEILREFYVLSNQFLKSLDIDFWLAYGTLLGYYRENDILKHDIDIDFGSTEKAYGIILRNKHKLPKGVKLFDTSKNHNGPKLFLSYKGFDADIYFYEEQGSLLNPFLISSIPSDMTPVKREYIYPLKQLDFLGTLSSLPANPKAYLEHCYGYIGRNAAFDKQTGYFYRKDEI